MRMPATFYTHNTQGNVKKSKCAYKHSKISEATSTCVVLHFNC